ncbi:TonB-dependent receptor plug domain-containing protein [Mucilaginibacter koreensis]
MNYKYKPAYLLSALFTAFVLLAGFVKWDDDPIKKIVAQLEKWTETYPQEKVYLHLDKPYYAAGDNLWFKAYVTVGPKHQLSALSGTLNVELIDSRDSIKKAIKLPVTSGICWGDFGLSDSLEAGTYRIRAYTNWMRNFSDEYFYDEPIVIGNALNDAVLTSATYNYTGQQTNATITYTNLNQTPYAGKQVNYTVKLDNRQVAKGKGLTDAKGNLSITFPVTVANYRSGQLVTQIKVADKRTVDQTIAFRAAAGQTNVQFFPESGNLVGGISSIIAFKAVGADGLGASIRGEVLDNDNQSVATLTTRHAGMGNFALLPQSGKTYHAVITYPDGTKNTVNLPHVQSSGYVLSLNQNSENVKARIAVSPDLAGKGDASNITLIAQANGVICYAGKVNLQGAGYSANIPKSRFPSGITQFTLFAANGQPVAERLVFVRNAADLLQLNVSSAKSAYTPREQVKINVHAQNSQGKPVLGSFSAAVIDETKVPVDEQAESTILSNLLLTSDLQGYIEKPNYYFTNIDDQVNRDLDVLMLTQGYRRFTWKNLLADNFPALKYQPEKALKVSGTVETMGGKPVPNSKVTLLATAGGAFILDTVTNAQGRFSFDNLLFKDSVRFIVQARTDKNKRNVQIKIDQPVQQSVMDNKLNADLIMSTNPNLITYLKNSRLQYDNDVKYGLNGHTILLKEVVIREKKAPILQHSANLNGAGNADQVIKSDVFDQLGCVTIDQCLQGRLVGVIFRNGVPYSTRSIGLSGNRPMQIIIDGTYVSSDFLLSLNPHDVSSVEVLRSGGNTAIYGSRGGNGVIIINTKRGDEYTASTYAQYSPGVTTYMPKGFYVAREFYKPVYAGPKATHSIAADLRTTIHWEHNLVTDNDGNLSFDFFNADSKGTYRVVIEGIDADGNLGRQVYRYKVE